MSRFTTIARRLTNLSAVLLLASWQVVFAFGPFMQTQTASAVGFSCVNDTAGANDEPNQKDLTRMCVNYDNSPTTISTTWNWDDLGTSGSNTLDACNLFDTDGDGKINYAVCVTTQGNPASIQTLTTYSCGDTKVDRCTSPKNVVSSGSTSCTISPQNTDPFPAGDGYPTDIQGACTIQLSTVGGTSAVLVDVCSYPSQEPNSDPSDCVVFVSDPLALIEVVKNVVPDSDPGLFNLTVDGPGTNDTTTVTDRGDNGTTGLIAVTPPRNGSANATVSETAGTGTNLADYSSSISCVNRSGGAVVVSGTGTSIVVPVSDGSNIICTITNTASASITIEKDAVPNSPQDFSFTTTGSGTTNFSLDDDTDGTLPNTRAFSNLAAGTYTFTEAEVTGWYLDSIDCPNITETQDTSTRTVSLTITAGQDVTCKFTNRRLGQIIVSKQTTPDNDPTQFGITASPGSGVVGGSAAQTIADNETETYTVKHGTYSVTETVPDGWTETSNNCSNLVINGNTTLVNGVPTLSCTITNTKLAKLKIIKDAIPDSQQDFVFSTTGTGLTGFILDDDADATLPNNQQFTNLNPGSYTVTEAEVAGWDMTNLVCTGSSTNSRDNFRLNITLAAGEDATCTFTNTQRGSIGGIKFNDLNANGIFDQGEPVLSGWTILLWSNNVQVDSEVTGADGSYSFIDLVNGLYSLTEVLQDGWTQTLAPAPVTLAAGQSSTGNNFGNFQNGSISGFKFNDVNGNGVYNDEPKLSGWTIRLLNDGPDEDVLLDDLVAQTTTDTNGNYSFTNLAPGTYQVCETQQANWLQKLPANNGCYMIVIDQSGETNPNTNFGNQGQGSITVIKNVDTDGDGDIDVAGATDWTWDIAGGAQNTATGSTVNVSAGGYTVSEDQKENYHVTSSICTGEETNPVSVSRSITVGTGENVTCTFVNTRDTGSITVNKVLNPTNDTGRFNLQIDDQTAGTGGNVGHGGTTGTIVVPTGTHSVRETAFTGTNLSDYSSSYSCTNQISGNGTATGNFTVTTGQNVTCTITNVRFASIVVQKQTLPDGSPVSFTFNANYDADGFNLSDGQSNNSGNLLPGTYSVSEIVPNGWDLSNPVTCSDQSLADAISLQAGETVTCVFTNTQRGSISGTKYEVNAGATTGTAGSELSGWTIFIDTNNNAALDTGEVSDITDVNGDYSFDSLVPGNYKVCEVLQANWTRIFPAGQPGCYNLTVDPGENDANNDFGNFRNGSISGYKFNDLNGNGIFNTGEPKLSGWTIYLDANSNSTLNQGETSTVTDVNGNYSFTNLVPGTYRVCEVPQAGYTQTSTPTCYSIEINQSNENNEAVFGNQGRGSITVVKNVDTDGDGDIDTTGATDWTWDLNGNYYSDSNIATGAGRTDIPADTYTVHEDQKADYHFVSVTCTGETALTQSETVTVTLSPGENITCTFVNARDTGSIVVQKELNPANDSGLFDLNVDGQLRLDDASDGDSTGSVQVTTGLHDVSETAGTSTNLADYESSYVCTTGTDVVSGTGTSVTGIDVDTNEVWTCVFTNNRRPTLTIVKDAEPDSEQDFAFTATGAGLSSFSLDDNGNNTDVLSNTKTFARLTSGTTYTVTETGGVAGWDLTGLSCSGTQNFVVTNNQVSVTPAVGENVTCTFVNTQRGHLVIQKTTDPAGDTTEFTINTTGTGTITGGGAGTVTDAADKDYEVTPGTYSVTETVPTGWDMTANTCTEVVVSAGQTATCQITNTKRGSITIIKDARPDSTQPFRFTGNLGDPSDEEGPNFTLVDDGDGDGSEQRAFTNLEEGTYTVTEPHVGGWTLESVTCEGGSDAVGHERNAVIKLEPGENVTCTFVNTRDSATVTVRKETLPANQPDAFTINLRDELLASLVHSSSIAGGQSDTYQVETGSYTLAEENIPAGWELVDVLCVLNDNEEVAFDPRDSGAFTLDKDDNLDCTFVNNYQIVLNLTKTNNKPNPVPVGEVVTYTLSASLPARSGTSYNTFVVDLPPEGFEYVPGSWTAVLTHADGTTVDLKANGTTPEPNYGSPGTWLIGTLLPGDTVTMTYRTVITSSVNAGTYPDVAFASGCGEATDTCPEDEIVLSNLSTANDPFVGTRVTVSVPQVLGASITRTRTVLVPTGSETALVQGFAALMLACGLALSFRADRSSKGGTK